MNIRKQQYNALKEKAGSGKILTATELRSLAKLEADLEDMGEDELVFTSADEVAEYSGYAKRTVWDAVKKELLIRQPDKTYLQDDVDTWLAARGRKPKKTKNEATTGDDQDCQWDRAEEEARYRHYRAIREKLLVDRLQGELLPREGVERQFVIRAHEYKTSLLLLSRSIAHLVAAKSGMDSGEVASIIDSEVQNILEAMSRPIEIEV